MSKRKTIAAVVVLLLAGIATVLWLALDWVPPRLLLRYGLSPGCEPTGRVAVIEGIEFVEIGPGCFRMGSTYGAGGDVLGRICAPLGLPWGERPRPTHETPVHYVEFSTGYWIGRHEITIEQYERFAPGSPRADDSASGRHPVRWCTWEQARAFCGWLARRSAIPVRLPSEAEWECACRAGSSDEYCFGDDVDRLSEYAWHDANSDSRVRKTGTRLPNAWMLYDLHGNAFEWCEDAWHDSYEGAPTDGSAWVVGGRTRGRWALHVGRGGSAWDSPHACRSAYRYPGGDPDGAHGGLGFRPAFSLTPEREHLVEPHLTER